MYTLVILSFLVGVANHGTGGDGGSAISTVPFTNFDACKDAATLLTRDGQAGPGPFALTKVEAYCVRTDQRK